MNDQGNLLQVIFLYIDNEVRAMFQYNLKKMVLWRSGVIAERQMTSCSFLNLYIFVHVHRNLISDMPCP